jgi:N-dimethylarginine dimethylaminohydrolase
MAVVGLSDNRSDRRKGPHVLDWGHHYLMTPPTYFGLSYSINPWMHPENTLDLERAHAQWLRLVSTLRAAGAQVDVRDGVPGLPDMVFAQQGGVVDGGRVVVSRFRYAERRDEATHAAAWFAARGFEVVEVDAPDELRWEAGDCFVAGDAFLCGYGPRSDRAGWAAVGRALGVRIAPVRLVNPLLYHLDVAFCPLDERRAIVAPDAFDGAGLATIRRLVPEPLLLTTDETMTFCANSVVVGTTVVMPHCPPRVGRQLEAWGFDVALTDTSEFVKAGGSVRCLTQSLDTSLAPARIPGVPAYADRAVERVG